MRLGRAVGVLVIVGSLVACGSGSSTRSLKVVLDDHGLEFPSDRIPAGRYVVSFVDHRSNPPAGKKVQLTLGQPDAVAVLVDAGHSAIATLLPHDVPKVLINYTERRVGHEDALTIEARPGYPLKLAIDFDDAGLKFSPSRIPAGRYVISFVDGRSHRPPNQHVTLQFGPRESTPLMSVKLGSHVVDELGAREFPWLVIDGVPQEPYDNGVPLITATPEFPNFAT